jgi:hypothetical protein
MAARGKENEAGLEFLPRKSVLALRCGCGVWNAPRTSPCCEPTPCTWDPCTSKHNYCINLIVDSKHTCLTPIMNIGRTLPCVSRYTSEPCLLDLPSPSACHRFIIFLLLSTMQSSQLPCMSTRRNDRPRSVQQAWEMVMHSIISEIQAWAKLIQSIISEIQIHIDL